MPKRSMARDERDGLRHVAMRQRDLRGGGAAERGGNTWDDFDVDIGGAERFDFFAATTEDEGVAALEAHDALAGLRGFNHATLDFVLGDGVLALGLADVNDLG